MPGSPFMIDLSYLATLTENGVKVGMGAGAPAPGQGKGQGDDGFAALLNLGATSDPVDEKETDTGRPAPLPKEKAPFASMFIIKPKETVPAQPGYDDVMRAATAERSDPREGAVLKPAKAKDYTPDQASGPRVTEEEPATAESSDDKDTPTDPVAAFLLLQQQLLEELRKVMSMLSGQQDGQAVSELPATAGGQAFWADIAKSLNKALAALNQGQTTGLSPEDLAALAQSLDKMQSLLQQLAGTEQPTDLQALFGGPAAQEKQGNNKSAFPDALQRILANTPDQASQDVQDVKHTLAALQTLLAGQQAPSTLSSDAPQDPIIDASSLAAMRKAMHGAGLQEKAVETIALPVTPDIKPAIAAAPATLSGAASAPVQEFSGMNTNSGGTGAQTGQQSSLAMPGAATGTNASSSTNGANAPQFSRMLNQAQSSPLTEQVTFHVKTALGDGSSRIHIQLDPAELGKLDIRLHVGADGKTGVVITAENKNTLDLLQRDAASLARALADAGLNTDAGGLSFNLRGDGQEQGRGQAALQYKKAQPEEEQEHIIPIIQRSYVVNLAEGLDIKI